LLGQVSKWVLGFFIVAAACFAPPDAYAQSGGSNDSVLQAPPSEGEINFVGRKAIQQGFEAVTGGKTRGSRRYSVERWLESTPYRFGTSMLILLWPANDAGLSRPVSYRMT
jgi:hypothetical protein